MEFTYSCKLGIIDFLLDVAEEFVFYACEWLNQLRTSESPKSAFVVTLGDSLQPQSGRHTLLIITISPCLEADNV